MLWLFKNFDRETLKLISFNRYQDENDSYGFGCRLGGAFFVSHGIAIRLSLGYSFVSDKYAKTHQFSLGIGIGSFIYGKNDFF